jgi:hypothetical protein
MRLAELMLSRFSFFAAWAQVGMIFAFMLDLMWFILSKRAFLPPLFSKASTRCCALQHSFVACLSTSLLPPFETSQWLRTAL